MRSRAGNPFRMRAGLVCALSFGLSVLAGCRITGPWSGESGVEVVVARQGDIDANRCVF